jgi:hypothetical protein
MWNTWRPGAPVLGAYPGYAASNSGEVQPDDHMMLEGMYETGRRFSLAGWSADEWARFFESAAGSASQVYATVANKPIATQPVPVVATPIGGVPTWAILGLVVVGGYFLLSARRR